MNSGSMGSQWWIHPTGAIGVLLPHVLLPSHSALCRQLEAEAGRKRCHAPSQPISVNTAPHLNSLWEKLSFISSQNTMLSRRTTEWQAFNLWIPCPVRVVFPPLPLVRKKANQLCSLPKGCFGNLMKAASSNSRLRTPSRWWWENNQTTRSSIPHKNQEYAKGTWRNFTENGISEK